MTLLQPLQTVLVWLGCTFGAFRPRQLSLLHIAILVRFLEWKLKDLVAKPVVETVQPTPERPPAASAAPFVLGTVVTRCPIPLQRFGAISQKLSECQPSPYRHGPRFQSSDTQAKAFGCGCWALGVFTTRCEEVYLLLLDDEASRLRVVHCRSAFQFCEACLRSAQAESYPGPSGWLTPTSLLPVNCATMKR